MSEAVLPASTVGKVLDVRTGTVMENSVGEGRFVLERGPYAHYSRTVEVEWMSGGPAGDPGRHARVRQVVEYDLDAPWWKWLVGPPIRHELARLVPHTRRPWWLPPDTLDRRSMRVLCVLSVLALAAGYQNALMSQTLTFAVKQFHASNFDQSVVIAVSRVDVVVALAMMLLADRVGRRAVLIQSVFWGAVLSAAGAVAPNLAWLAVTQTAARSFVAASVALVTIYAAEEMPAGSRAYALGMLTAVGVGGAGVNVFLLVGVDTYGWRVIFALAALGCFFVPACARGLPESKRFVSKATREARRAESDREYEGASGDRSSEEPPADPSSPARSRPAAAPRRDAAAAPRRDAAAAPRRDAAAAPRRDAAAAPRRDAAPTLRNHMERLLLIVALGFLIQTFALPTTQFLNQFLRTERGYTAAHIVLYNVFTTIPGALGLFGGGRLADRYGRRIVAGFSLVVGSAAMVGGYLTWGWEMWFFHMVAQILAGALIPATAILGPEIFPTGLRGKAFGVFTIAQGAGSVLGLLLVGQLSGRAYFGNLGLPIALMATGPALMAIILVAFFPETAHLELEAINPEDSPPVEDVPPSEDSTPPP